MPQMAETKSMAIFCDFENVALGVRDAKYPQFDIRKILERLLLKGNIVVKKAYADWSRYRECRAGLHEASFELIEIPHVRISGKNSADIRMVVDALDLCYTKSHVDTFVIISGDSDFSPLVSKLRENNKTVIGVGVENSTAELLIANCDEFISYDDLVKTKRSRPRPKARSSNGNERKTAKVVKPKTEEAAPVDPKKQEAWDLIVETYDALLEERGEEDSIWGSMIKQALKRRKPGFSESHYGFRTFGQLLEEAGSHGILDLIRDDKSGGFIIKGAHAPETSTETSTEGPAEKSAETPSEISVEKPTETPADTPARRPGRRPARRPSRRPAVKTAETPAETPPVTPAETSAEIPSEVSAEKPTATPANTPSRRPGRRPARRPAAKKAETQAESPAETSAVTPAVTSAETPAQPPAEAPAEKPAGRPAKKAAKKRVKKTAKKVVKKPVETPAETST